MSESIWFVITLDCCSSLVQNQNQYTFKVICPQNFPFFTPALFTPSLFLADHTPTHPPTHTRTHTHTPKHTPKLSLLNSYTQIFFINHACLKLTLVFFNLIYLYLFFSFFFRQALYSGTPNPFIADLSLSKKIGQFLERGNLWFCLVIVN